MEQSCRDPGFRQELPSMALLHSSIFISPLPGVTKMNFSSKTFFSSKMTIRKDKINCAISIVPTQNSRS